MTAPLSNLRIIEIEAIGPAPFAAMLLADLGAEVIRIGRPKSPYLRFDTDVTNRNKKSIVLDLKTKPCIEALLKLIKNADVLLEGFRPGVMERLGVGPDICLQINPRLIYGRMTGWGQTGPLSQAAGHDINFISLSGALNAIGRKGEKPTVPLNLVGDFGGGSMFMVLGVLAALYERQTSNKGQVIDAAMVDGVATLMSSIFAGLQSGLWNPKRGENLLDSGSPCYDTYETQDGKYISVGSIEPKFYEQLVVKLGIQDEAPPIGKHMSPKTWSKLRNILEAQFKTKTRDEWCEAFKESDACITPVLGFDEARQHPHAVQRGSYVEVQGIVQPIPAPRFSRSIPDMPKAAHDKGADTREILKELGIPDEQIEAIIAQ